MRLSFPCLSSRDGEVAGSHRNVVVDPCVRLCDGLNRLTGIKGPIAESVALDGASNIASRTGPSQTDTYDQANRLTSDGTSAYTWSNADRLINRGSDTFGYDPIDRLISSSVSGTSRSYAYNGDGILASRTQGT